MELLLYVDILKRRALVIALVTAVAVSVVIAAGFLIPPVYTASTTVRVILDVGLPDLLVREGYSASLLNTYTHILKSTPVLEEAISRLSPGTTLTARALRENVEAELIPNTELITISVQDEDLDLRVSL